MVPFFLFSIDEGVCRLAGMKKGIYSPLVSLGFTFLDVLSDRSYYSNAKHKKGLRSKKNSTIECTPVSFIRL